jgi:hypothetical protein
MQDPGPVYVRRLQAAAEIHSSLTVVECEVPVPNRRYFGFVFKSDGIRERRKDIRR